MRKMTRVLVALMGCLLPLSAAAAEPLAVFDCQERLGRDWPETLVTHQRSFEAGKVRTGGANPHAGCAPPREGNLS